MAKSPRLIIEEYMQKYECDLFEVSCIVMLHPDILYPYMNKETKRLEIADKIRLVRLGCPIVDILDKMKHSAREMMVLEVLGMTLMTPEQLKEVAGIPVSTVDTLYNGGHANIGDASIEALQFIRGRFPDISSIREETKVYLSKAMGIKRNMDEKAKKEAATLFNTTIQDLLQCYQPVEQQKLLEQFEDDVSNKDDEIKALRQTIDGLMKEAVEKDATIERLRQELYDATKGTSTSSVSKTDDQNLQELIYQKDMRIADLTERLKKRTEETGSIHELYAGELDYILTDVLTQYMENNPKRQRRKDILKEFLQKTVTTDVKATQDSMEDVVKAITATRDMGINTTCIKAGPFTLDLKSSNNHHKYVINGDERYTVTMAITPSDYRAGEEAVKYFMREFT